MSFSRLETQASTRTAGRRAIVLTALLAAAPGVATARSGPPISRILAGESASVVLQQWCRSHGLPPLRAEPQPQTRSADADVRAELRVGQGDTIAHRRVALKCGRMQLSSADNWYLPARLTAAMNRRLQTTRTPFGLVVAPLGFRRRTTSLGRTPDGGVVIHAVLERRGGARFSYVIEHYDARLAQAR